MVNEELEGRVTYSKDIPGKDIKALDLDMIGDLFCNMDVDVETGLTINPEKTKVRFYTLDNKIKMHIELYPSAEEKVDKRLTLKEAREYIGEYLKDTGRGYEILKKVIRQNSKEKFQFSRVMSQNN
jgi:hypothetical protein